MNLNFDPVATDIHAGILHAKSSANAAMHFYPGMRSIPVMNQASLDMNGVLIPGKKFMSFDIETAGLMRNQIREISYKTGSVGAGGSLIGGSDNQLLFNPIALRRGTIGKAELGGAVRPTTLPEFLGIPGIGSSDDFAKAMMPWLQSVKDSDYIIGHNISGFDIPQVHSQLISTEAYKGKLPGFKELVDEAFTGIDSKVVDTLTLAQRASNLSGITVHEDLLRMGDARAYSISNLLLQTDLAELIGPDEVRNALSKGLHNADVDDLVTRGLLQHLGSLQLKPMTERGMIEKIISSSALTPFTNATSASEISDNALRHLIANVDDGIKIPMGDAYPTENRILADLIQQARSGVEGSTDKAFRMLRSSDQLSGLVFNINPIEQQVFETRNLGLGVPTTLSKSIDPTSYIFRTNLYDDMAYDGMKRRDRSPIRGQRGDIPAQEFEQFQRRMASLNMPFAGLAREERRFATGLSQLTGGIWSPKDGFNLITSDTLVSSFNMFDPSNDALQYVTRSGRTSLPASILSKYGAISEGSLLDLSTVDATAYGGKNSVNLVHRFGSVEEATAFADQLDALAGRSNLEIAEMLGIDSSMVPESAAADVAERFRAGIREGLTANIRTAGHTTGVSIGQIYGDEATGIIDFLKEIHGGDLLRDDSMLPFRLPFMGTKVLDDLTGRGIIQTAGAVLDSGLTPSDSTIIQRSVRHARQVYEGFVDLAVKPENTHAFDAAKMAAGLGPKGAAATKTGFELYQKMRPNIGKVVAGVLVAGFGIHEYRKHKENEPYNEVFAPQPAPSSRKYNVAFLLQQKKDMGIDMSRQGYSPLDTAYVVDNLNSAKIGHTNMSSNKNTALYGGVL